MSQESSGDLISVPTLGKEGLDSLRGAQAPGPSLWLSFPTLAFIPLTFPTSSTYSSSSWSHGLHYSNVEGENRHWTDNQLLMLTDKVPETTGQSSPSPGGVKGVKPGLVLPQVLGGLG